MYVTLFLTVVFACCFSQLVMRIIDHFLSEEEPIYRGTIEIKNYTQEGNHNEK